MQNPAHVARVLHPCEVVEQRGEAPLSKGKVSIEGIIGGSAFWVAASIQKIASLPAVI